MNTIDLSPLLRASQARNQQQLTNAYSVADTTAAREAADYEAAANQQTAAAQTSLAYKLAQARQTPGGGIRMGVRKGATAGSMGAGLNKANAASKLAKRQAELRAQAKQQYDAQRRQSTGGLRVSVGQPVGQIFY